MVEIELRVIVGELAIEAIIAGAPLSMLDEFASQTWPVTAMELLR